MFLFGPSDIYAAMHNGFWNVKLTSSPPLKIRGVRGVMSLVQKGLRFARPGHARSIHNSPPPSLILREGVESRPWCLFRKVRRTFYSGMCMV